MDSVTQQVTTSPNARGLLRAWAWRVGEEPLGVLYCKDCPSVLLGAGRDADLGGGRRRSVLCKGLAGAESLQQEGVKRNV